MITNDLTIGGDYKIRLDNRKNNYLENIKSRIAINAEQHQQYLNGRVIERKTCDNPYDREKALSYANKWVTTRNSEWPRYDTNCQNYASQMMYEGGIPMDRIGSIDAHLQWSSPKNNDGTPLVYTWTFVPYFYTYVKNNSGYGLCGAVDVNLYYAEPGDVINMGITGPTRHVSVVSGAVYKDGKVVDILVHSNSIDLENFPMSAYVYHSISLLKIYGWNEK